MAGTYVRSYFIITIVYSFKNALHMMLYFSMTKISCFFFVGYPIPIACDDYIFAVVE
jgi:hypothetical protein